ncbi:MAG: tryptophan 7-halogenase [Pseudomonadota bacterium]
MTQGNGTLSTIAVFGRSHALWPVAALLARHLPEYIELVLIEEDGDVDDGAALTLPWRSRFHDALGLTPVDLVKQCNGVFGLGVDLRDWRGEGSRFFLAPSGTLPAINGVALHHVMLRAATMYEDADRLDYLLRPFRFAARAAEAGKFADPADGEDSPLAMLGPTIQCERVGYAAMMKGRFPTAEARIERGRPVDVTLDPDSANIAVVALDDGRKIAADMFVDVSGTLSELIPDRLAPARHSLSAIFAFDRHVRCKRTAADLGGAPAARALAGGLLVETPVRDGICSELLFSSDATAEGTAREVCGGDGRSTPFAAFFMETPWTGNVARLGAASARLGPYMSADMLLLHEQALHLVRCIPARRDMAVEATTFNRKQLCAAEQLRDFLALPFVLNARADTPWTDIRKAELPDSLALRLAQFRSRGRFVTFDDELFDRQSWIDAMIGFGIVPERYDPLVDAMDMRRIAPALKQMVDGFDDAIDAMPDRAAYLADAGLDPR